MPDKDPTANYRTYPKGPDFGGIVIWTAVIIIVLLALGVLFVRSGGGRKVDPVKRNPTPNSSLRHQPELPDAKLG